MSSDFVYWCVTAPMEEIWIVILTAILIALIIAFPRTLINLYNYKRNETER